MAGLATVVSNLNPKISLNGAVLLPPSPRLGAVRLHRGGLAVLSARSRLPRRCLGIRAPEIGRRRWPGGFFTFAVPHDDSKDSEIQVEDQNELNRKADEVWKQKLKTFKEEALKMQAISLEAYEEYSKKALVILKESSEKLKIETEKARIDLTRIAKEISEEGKVYLSSATENPPEQVKDIVETFTSLPNELKEVSEVRDYYLGIPYGAFLSVGGFLSFMLTGSLSAIRFGVVLGGALLALSVSSLRSYKSGQPSSVFLKGQAAIASVIFIRELRLFSQRGSFPGFLMFLISGAMLVFYAYRITVDERNSGPSLEQGTED
ncbi:hypothetical protein QJS04_geneDACA017008 [Acorus gramineus]|uniref:Protein FATTY ACID EXPORT 3, chloroplastic n=1 Tax=Acorus gramineus TaxID=55184 RepID=A0AAV9AMP1_ACOGR|nr:hypothetical protein QJS04_geneDACA017008 [Acorus gramineus]